MGEGVLIRVSTRPGEADLDAVYNTRQWRTCCSQLEYLRAGAGIQMTTGSSLAFVTIISMKVSSSAEFALKYLDSCYHTSSNHPIAP